MLLSINPLYTSNRTALDCECNGLLSPVTSTAAYGALMPRWAAPKQMGRLTVILLGVMKTLHRLSQNGTAFRFARHSSVVFLREDLPTDSRDRRIQAHAF